MKLLIKLSVGIIWMSFGCAVLLIALTLFSSQIPDTKRENEKKARIACMTELQLLSSDRIIYGTMPGDKVVVYNGENRYTVHIKLKYKNIFGGETPANISCDVVSTGDDFKVLSLINIQR